ncbi:MAG TPA: ABC transporter permease, partial [Gemmatimonadales bacterium]|nr:ABC transporter permease [Gemmatimonadales bacterium]
ETCVLALVHAYLVRGLPYPGSERLYSVAYAGAGEATPQGLSEVDWLTVSDVVEHPIAWDLDVFYLVGGDHPERAPGAWVTPGFMRGLGIQPAMGRAFTPDEFQPGGPQVALISHALWRSRFGGDSTMIGRSFQAYVSDRPDDPELFTVVGVLPAGFWHLNPYTQVLTPLRALSYPYLVKLRAGVTPEAGAERITQLIRSGGVPLPRPVELRSVHREYGRRLRPLLLATGSAVTLVLLTACANVTFLMVLRGIRRQKDVAVRLALGAGTARIAQSLVTEALVLTGTAGLIGLGGAALALRPLAPVVERQLGRAVPGGAATVSIDWPVLVAVAALLLVVGALLALTPLVATTRSSLYAVMRSGRQAGTEGRRGRRIRMALVAVEVAGSLALVVGAGLTVRTVLRMLQVESGVQSAGVIGASLALRDRTYPDASSRIAFSERLARALEATPGITASALSYPPPLAELDARPVETDGETGGIRRAAGVFLVTPGFFATLQIPLLQGRLLSPGDRGATEPVAMVSETAARHLWPNVTALGQRLRVELPAFMTDGAAPITRTVVGVVRDVRHSPGDDQMADVYLPWLQVPGRFARLLIRAPGEPVVWRDGLRRLLAEIDPEVSLDQVSPLDDTVREQLARPRFLARLFTTFGLFAATLGVMGVYAVTAYAVQQREREVAVRIAVGAAPRSVTALFLRQAALVLAAGMAAGLVAAAGLGRLLQTQLYGVPPVDPVTLVVAGA